MYAATLRVGQRALRAVIGCGQMIQLLGMFGQRVHISLRSNHLLASVLGFCSCNAKPAAPRPHFSVFAIVEAFLRVRALHSC